MEGGSCGRHARLLSMHKGCTEECPGFKALHGVKMKATIEATDEEVDGYLNNLGLIGDSCDNDEEGEEKGGDFDDHEDEDEEDSEDDMVEDGDDDMDGGDDDDDMDVDGMTDNLGDCAWCMGTERFIRLYSEPNEHATLTFKAAAYHVRSRSNKEGECKRSPERPELRDYRDLARGMGGSGVLGRQRCSLCESFFEDGYREGRHSGMGECGPKRIRVDASSIAVHSS
jgi:hypothetical protein